MYDEKHVAQSLKILEKRMTYVTPQIIALILRASFSISNQLYYCILQTTCLQHGPLCFF